MVNGTLFFLWLLITDGADKFEESKRTKFSFIIFPEPAELNLIVMFKTRPTLTSIEILNKTNIFQFR